MSHVRGAVHTACAAPLTPQPDFRAGPESLVETKRHVGRNFRHVEGLIFFSPGSPRVTSSMQRVEALYCYEARTATR